MLGVRGKWWTFDDAKCVFIKSSLRRNHKVVVLGKMHMHFFLVNYDGHMLERKEATAMCGGAYSISAFIEKGKKKKKRSAPRGVVCS